MKQSFGVKELVFIAILGSISTLLMYLKFPLPFMPPFMNFDFAAIPEIVGAFILGPIAGVFIILVKILLMIILMGTSTMFAGELQNFILSCAFVLPAAIIYRRNKTKQAAINGLIVGVIVLTITSIITNIFFIIPFYATLFGISVDDVIKMASAVNPLINDKLTLALFGIVPFNIFKGGISAIITVLIYKKISILFKNYSNV